MVDDNSKDQVLALYHVYVDDIQFIKQQMWRMIYYCLVLFAVLFYLADFYGKRGNLEHPLFHLPYTNFEVSINHVLFISSLFVAVIGLYFLYNFSRHLKDERVGLANIKYWYFDTWLRYIVYSSLQNLSGQQILERMEKECSNRKDLFYLATFIIVIIAALAIVAFRITTNSLKASARIYLTH